MALLWAEGFDYLNVGRIRNAIYQEFLSAGLGITLEDTSLSTRSRALIVTETTGKSLAVVPSMVAAGDVIGIKGLKNSDTTLGVGFNLTRVGGVAPENSIEFYLGDRQITITVDAASMPRLSCSAGVFIGDHQLSSGGGSYFIEVRIDTSAGEVELLVNGESSISETGLSMSEGVLDGVGIRCSSGSESSECRFDDIIVWNTEPGSVTSFTGPVKVQAVHPDTVGATNEWTTEGAAGPVEALSTPYGDGSSYITAPSGKTLELVIPALATSTEVLGVKYQFNAGVDAPQARQLSAGFGTPTNPQSVATDMSYLTPVVIEADNTDYAEDFVIYSG